MVNEEQGELLTVRQVARRCNRSEETIRRWIWSGKLQARKLGNQLFVRATEVDARGDVQREIPRITWSLTDLSALEAREQKLRQKLFKQHGYFNAADLVRESREGH